MMEHTSGEKCLCGEDMFGLESLAKEFKKEFKMALLKKKEKILEAKLDFIREINSLLKKSSDFKETNE